MKDIKDRIEVLRSKHTKLKEKLAAAQKSYASDRVVNAIKKEKLKIKDLIAYLTRDTANDSNQRDT